MLMLLTEKLTNNSHLFYFSDTNTIESIIYEDAYISRSTRGHFYPNSLLLKRFVEAFSFFNRDGYT